jgi:hypothetical protein
MEPTVGTSGISMEMGNRIFNPEVSRADVFLAAAISGNFLGALSGLKEPTSQSGLEAGGRMEDRLTLLLGRFLQEKLDTLRSSALGLLRDFERS